MSIKPSVEEAMSLCVAEVSRVEGSEEGACRLVVRSVEEGLSVLPSFVEDAGSS